MGILGAGRPLAVTPSRPCVLPSTAGAGRILVRLIPASRWILVASWKDCACLLPYLASISSLVNESVSFPMSCRYMHSGLEHCWYRRNALQYLVVPKHARSTLPSSVVPSTLLMHLAASSPRR